MRCTDQERDRMNPALWTAQFRKGLVEFCVLATLEPGEAYGYQILERLNAAPGLATAESTVYPLLARLERDGHLTVRTAPSPSGPPRRYYRLTPAGRTRLRNMARYWFQIQDSINHLVKEHRNDDGPPETER
jgi:PadR family transcriptional regulator PadR